MFSRNSKLNVECLESRQMLSADVGWIDPPPDIRLYADFAESPVRMPGDANLDGHFNSSDLVRILQCGEYEDGVEGNSSWAEGDFNGDRDFDSSDLVLVMQADCYEKAPPGQNPLNPYDVDFDGVVCPFDAVCIANELNAHDGDEPIPLLDVFDKEYWLDVNDDGQIDKEDFWAVARALPDSGPCDISLDEFIDQYGLS